MKWMKVLCFVCTVIVLWSAAAAIAAPCKHEYDYNNPTPYNGTTHKVKCKLCGNEITVQHSASCTTSTPNTCDLCGATGVTVQLSHNYSGGYHYNTTHHWYQCKDCGNVTSKEVHEVDSAGNCYCGATGLIQYVSSIKLNTSSKIFELGSGAAPTFQIEATVSPSNAANQTLQYMSSDLKVATVSQEGIITAVDEGTCTITVAAQDGSGTKATCSVKVKYKLVEKIELSETEKTVRLPENGDEIEYQLYPTVIPSDAKDQSVTYSSSNMTVAEVDKYGTVTCKKPGTTIITVTAKDGSGVTATQNLMVSDGKVQEIILNTTNITRALKKGETITAQLIPTIRPADATNKRVDYTTSDPSVATVSSDGLITAKGEGSCVITVTAKDGGGAYAVATVKVKDIKVTSVTVKPTSIIREITKGGSATVQITSTVLPSDATNTDLNYTSSNENVAKVSNSGLVTCVGEGTCTITVSSTDGSGQKGTVSVKVKPKMITGITLNTTSIIRVLDTTKDVTVKLVPTIEPKDAVNQKLSYSSSNTTVAAVDSNGVITMKKVGTCTITAQATDGSGIKATCSVKVKSGDVESIKLNTTSITRELKDGQTPSVQLTATITPNDASNKKVTWKSSNEAVATVSSNGLVKVVGVGTSTITVTASDGSGVKATCTVKGKRIEVTDIKLNTTSIIREMPNTAKLAATVIPGNAHNTGVTYKSSNDKIATVSSDGTVKGVAPGTCTITVTANGNSSIKKTVSVKIKEKQVEKITLNATSKIMEMKVGGDVTFQLKATITPSNASNKGIKWTSSNTSVATVSDNGLITCKGPGTCTITAKAKDAGGVSATCSVKVKKILVSSITLNATKVVREIKAGEALPTAQLTPSFEPKYPYSKRVSYTSSNTSVATVDKNGKITCVGPGNCTITVAATDGSGVKATCSVKVK